MEKDPRLTGSPEIDPEIERFKAEIFRRGDEIAAQIDTLLSGKTGDKFTLDGRQEVEIFLERCSAWEGNLKLYFCGVKITENDSNLPSYRGRKIEFHSQTDREDPREVKRAAIITSDQSGWESRSHVSVYQSSPSLVSNTWSERGERRETIIDETSQVMEGLEFVSNGMTQIERHLTRLSSGIYD